MCSRPNDLFKTAVCMKLYTYIFKNILLLTQLTSKSEFSVKTYWK